jgi:hypothetical protein
VPSLGGWRPYGHDIEGPPSLPDSSAEALPSIKHGSNSVTSRNDLSGLIRSISSASSAAAATARIPLPFGYSSIAPSVVSTERD